jgi:phosphate transport system substrate-binding protein
MNSSFLLKVIGLVVVSAIIIFISFFAIVFTNLMGLIKFYTPFIIVMTVGVLFFITNGFFKFLNAKQVKVSFISFLSLLILSVIVYESIDAYHNSFETLADQEVDLYQYQPFGEFSKVATLEEEATLKLEGKVPVLDGATALYPLYAAFAQATYPQKEYDVYFSEVMSNKTTEAYTNLINGRADIIFAAGPSERQLNQAKSMGVELKLTPIGREAFVFFVNSKNPVEGLTIQQIQDIYSGKITNWSEVGGKREDIKAFQRPADSGSQTALENLMGEIPIMEAPKEDVVAGMGGIIEQTSNYRNYKNAIGYSFRYFSMDMIRNESIRHLKIEGVYPDKETIRNNQYPISAEFYAITAGSTNPNIEAFIEWILSKQGQSLVEKTGYVPIH